MKSQALFLFSSILLIFPGCSSKEGTDGEKSVHKKIYSYPEETLNTSWPLPSGMGHHDTINLIDQDGMKQGRWMILGKMAKDTSYKPEALIEKGRYVNNKKDGKWWMYNPDGSLKDSALYKNDVRQK